MHELSVCQALIEQVKIIAQSHCAQGVDQIIVQIGPLSGIEPQLLKNAYSIACAGTVAEKAVLEIESMPITVRCQQCGEESEVAMNRLICPVCGDYRTQLMSGDEILLKTVGLTGVNEEKNHV